MNMHCNTSKREEANSEVLQKYLIVQGWETKKSWLPRQRIDEVLLDSKKVKKWLDEKEAEQAKTSSLDKPAFTSDEVLEKVLDLQEKVASVDRIPKPKPKVVKPVKNETESNTENNTSNQTDSSSSSKESISPEDDTEGESESSTNEKASDSEAHDEL